MSERYYITGVQLGMLKALITQGKSLEVHKIIDEVIDIQFIGDKEYMDKMLGKEK